MTLNELYILKKKNTEAKNKKEVLLRFRFVCSSTGLARLLDV